MKVPKPKSSKKITPEGALVKAILSTAPFRGAELRSKLFGYLFKYRIRFISSDEIIEKVFGITTSYLKAEERVRERCGDLRSALHEFALTTTCSLICTLPDAVPGVGYKLEFRAREPDSVFFRFWKPHLVHGLVYIVYVEQLFYQDWSRRFLFRHPELNAEAGHEALVQLKIRYPEEFSEELNAAYPYVAYGEIGARDCLTRWFTQTAYIGVEIAVTRRMDDTKVWSSSAILLGEERSNSMIRDVFNQCVPLDMRLEVIDVEAGTLGRACVMNPSEAEISRNAHLKPSQIEGGYAISYDPKAGRVLLLLTRVLNNQSKKVITILNSEFARTIEQTALLFTEGDRLQALLDEIGWGAKIPSEFQILFSYVFDSIPTAHRIATPQILAWRSYAE